MQPVTVKYQPLPWPRIKLTANGFLPESWAELNPLQFITISKLAKETVDDIAFLAAMTGIRKRIIKRLDDFHRFQMNEAFHFFTTDTSHNAFVLQKFKINGVVYAAPKPKLNGMTFEQFIFIDTWFGFYQDENKPENLHSFLASLYLPAGEKFNEEKTELNALLLANLHPSVKDAIVLNYQLVKAWIQKTYPLIFPELDKTGTENDEQKQQTEKRRYDSSGWIKIFDGIVGDNITKRDKYAAMPLHETLRYMSRRIKENMKRKK